METTRLVASRTVQCLDTRDEDTDQLVGLIKQLMEPVRVCKLMFMQQFKPECALLQLLKHTIELGDTVGLTAGVLRLAVIGSDRGCGAHQLLANHHRCAVKLMSLLQMAIQPNDPAGIRLRPLA